MTNRKGFTLTEMVVSLFIGILILMVGMYAIKHVSQFELGISEKSRTEDSVFVLADHILKVGRTAGGAPNPNPRTCVNTTDSLTCAIDLNHPPTGVTIQVRFRRVPADHQVIYEQEKTPGVWETQLTYRLISDLIFCGDATMTDGTCPIANPKMLAQHAADIGVQTALSAPLPPAPLPVTPAATPVNRFFLFKIKGLSARQNETSFSAPVEIESAFFTRNPPFAGDPNVMYQYGTK